MAGGRWVVQNGRHKREEQYRARFREVLGKLV